MIHHPSDPASPRADRRTVQVRIAAIQLLVVLCTLSLSPSWAVETTPAADSPKPTASSAVQRPLDGIAVCGQLTENTTWDLPSSPVHVTCDTTVPLNLSLTIEAGVIVQFEHPTDDIVVAGTLNVQGSEDFPVTFQPASAQVAGSWGQVRIDPGAVAMLDHAVLEYGGYKENDYYEEGMLVVIQGQLELRDSTVRDSANSGMVIWNASPLIHGTRFEGNTAGCGLWSGSYRSMGGGIRIHGGSPTIEDSVFRGNNATSHPPACAGGSALGGAIYSENSAPTIRRSEFHNNWAEAEGYQTAAYGGAIYQGYATDTTIWEDNSFEGHWIGGPPGSAGNAVYAGANQALLRRNSFVNNFVPPELADPDIRTSSTLFVAGWYSVVEDSTFRGNSAWECGALHAGYDTVIRNSLFEGNVSEASGGAVCASTASAIEGNTFSGNTASGINWRLPYGGALYCNQCASVRDNVFVNNQNLRGWGGAIYVEGGNPLVGNNRIETNDGGSGALYLRFGDATIQNNVFVGNTSWAIHQDYSTGSITRNNTLYNNSGGIYVLQTATIYGNIIANNAYGAIFATNPGQQIDYNDYWDDTYGGGMLLRGPHDISADPLFVDPEAGDFHLGVGSPCIDSGHPDSYAPTDFEREARPQGGQPDMGADEAPAGTGPAVKPSLTIAIQGEDLSLSWTIAEINAAYELWSAPIPYFAPRDPDATLLADGKLPACTVTGGEITCADMDVLGNSASHHFYRVRAFTAAGAWADSNTVGEFEFGLVSAE